MSGYLWKALAAVACAALFACPANLVSAQTVYAVSGDRITANGAPWCAGGDNSFDQWGQNTPPAADHIKIVREALDDFSQISSILAPGTAIGAPGGGTLHSLQDMVAANRAAGEITILCPFNWDGTGSTTFSGADPTSQSYFSAYLTQLGNMAAQFAGQTDVWIDPWNEPNFSSDTDWSTYCTDIYSAIRNAGNTNIILIPGENYDSDPSVFVRQAAFLSGRASIVADIHAYAYWTEWEGTPADQASVIDDIDTTRIAGWPVIVGEVGPSSGNALTDADFNACKPFLGNTVAMSVPTLAWSWDSGDGDALSSGSGLTYWGGIFVPYLSEYAPGSGTGLTAETPGIYALKALGSGLYIDDPSGAGAGSGVDQQPYSGIDQQWRLVAEPFGFYEIESVASGMALTGATAQQAATLEPFTGAADQLWGLVAYNGSQEIVDQANTDVLNVYANSNSAGAAIGLWYGSTGATNELWTPSAVLLPPAAPSGLSAKAASGSVTLTWSAVSGATSYSVFRGTSPGAEAVTPIATGVTTAAYTDSGLTNGVTYYYTVEAVNAAGASSASNEASATPAAAGRLTLTSNLFRSTGYNLSSLGKFDWAYWDGPFVHKSLAKSLIGNVVPVGPPGAVYGAFSLNNVNISWTGGTPIATGTDSHKYITCHGTTGQGWSITVPAYTSLRTLVILSGGSANGSAIRLTAHLSDGSAPDVSLDQTTSKSKHLWVRTITYRALSAGQTLTVTLTKNDTNANTSVILVAAWLR